MARIRHDTIPDSELHNPKGFVSATKGELFWKNQGNSLEYIQTGIFPAALNFVDGDSAPPTEVDGDIYVLVDSTSVHADWDGASNNNWVKFNGTNWEAISVNDGAVCYDKTANKLKEYDGSNWTEVSPLQNTIYSADDTLTENRTVNLGTNTLAFNNGSVLLNASSKVASEDILLSGQTYIQRASTSSADTILSLLDNVGTELWDWRANGDVYQGNPASWNLNGNNLTYELGTNLLTFNTSRNSNGYIINKSGTGGFGLHVEVNNASSGGISVDANSSSYGLSVFSTNGNIISTYKYSGNDGIKIGNGAGFNVRPFSVLGGDVGANSLGSGRYVNAQFGLSSDGIELGYNSTNGGGVIWGKGKEIEIEALTVGIGYQSHEQASKLQVNGDLGLVDGMTAPSATAGVAKLYVDTADGDLKVIFGNGTIKTIATDTLI